MIKIAGVLFIIAGVAFFGAFAIEANAGQNYIKDLFEAIIFLAVGIAFMFIKPKQQ